MLATKLFGQPVKRQREFNEGIGISAVAIFFPAQFQRFSERNNGVGDGEHGSIL